MHVIHYSKEVNFGTDLDRIRQQRRCGIAVRLPAGFLPMYTKNRRISLSGKDGSGE